MGNIKGLPSEHDLARMEERARLVAARL
jgi:hypothetical protein